MGWIWALAVVGVLVGAGAVVDRRRYRAVTVSSSLSGRAKRAAIRRERAMLAHRESPARYSPYTPLGGDGGGGGDSG